jgi:hypothetical protein
MADKYDEMDLNELLSLEGMVAQFKADALAADYVADVVWRNNRSVQHGPTPEAAVRAAVQQLAGKHRDDDLVRAHSAACLLARTALRSRAGRLDGEADPSRCRRCSPGSDRWLRTELGDDLPVEVPEEFDPLTAAQSYLNALGAKGSPAAGVLDDAIKAFQGLLR